MASRSGAPIDSKMVAPIIGGMMTNQRIDLHTHTIFSDGALLPSELLRRAQVLGHRAIAITDHADASNIEALVSSLRRVALSQAKDFETTLIVGVELTHVAPHSIAPLARRARRAGAEIVLVHGETIVEPVAAGTNRAAVECLDVDVLAHPGFLSVEEACLAAERGMCIEITARKGHSLTNGHVVRVCTEAGALMVLNTDTHTPDNLADLAFAQAVARGAGLDAAQVQAATIDTPAALLAQCLARRSYNAI